MPSSQTNQRALARKIAELEDQAHQGLSDSNARQLHFFRLWQEFQGRDIVLVIVPKGVVNAPGERAKARMVECHDAVAADKLAFAEQRSQRVRLATPKEVEAYRARNRRQQEIVRSGQARAAQDMLKAQLSAILGQGVPAGGAQTTLPNVLEPGPVPQPSVDDPPSPSDGILPEDQALADLADPSDLAEDRTEPEAHPALEGIQAKQLQACVAAGFDTIAKLADVNPSDLAKAVNGVGDATAARIVVAASEAQAAIEEKAETEGGGGASGEGDPAQE